MSLITNNQIPGIPRLDTAVLRREATALPAGSVALAPEECAQGHSTDDANLTRIPFRHEYAFIDPLPPPPEKRHGVPLVQRLRP